MLIALFSSSVQASEGPWTTAPGLHNLYLGVMAERFECFDAKAEGQGPCAPGMAVTSPVNKVGAKIFYRTGVTSNMDVALSVPIARAFASESVDSPLYATNTGVGLVQGRLRYQLASLAGVDTAASLGVRSGAAHYSSRGQVTNLGEGTTDLVGAVYLGHTGLGLRRFYTASMDVSYIYRLPELVDTAHGRMPGDEVNIAAVSTLAMSQHVGVGVSLDGNWRLWGEELAFSELSKYGDDRWLALAASQVKVGGRVVFYPSDSLPYIQVSGMRAVWARNNPTDTTQVEVALGTDFGRRK